MEPQVSATLILDQMRLMREQHGEAIVAEALASLPGGVRQELEDLLPGRWCSTDAARMVKEAVAQRLGEPVLSLQRRVVRLGIERTLNTFWRFFMRQLGDAALMRRTPILYARSFNRGELRFISVAERQAQLELHGWPTIPDFDLVGLSAGIETVLALSGRVEPHVATSRRGVVVHFVGEWKAPRIRAAGD